MCDALSWCLAAAAAIYPAQHGSWGALEVHAGASRTPIDHSHFVSHTLLTSHTIVQRGTPAVGARDHIGASDTQRVYCGSVGVLLSMLQHKMHPC